MGLINAIKKKCSALLPKKKKLETEKVAFSDIEHYIDGKEEEIGKEKDKASKLIKENISQFAYDMREKLAMLKNVNLDKAKEDLRIKHLVLTNMNEYKTLAEKLILEIENTKNIGYDELTKKINSNFFEFRTKSQIKYQKATFLIGKEMGDINECINRFFREYSRIITQNERFLEKINVFEKAKSHLNSLKEIEKDRHEIEEKIRQINSETKILKNKSNEFSTKIEEIKKTREYLDNMENIKKEKALLSEIDREIAGLKQLIDFKALSGIFHSSGKYMISVNKFREHFTESFKEDKGETLLGLLEEAKLSREETTKRVKEIIDMSENASEIKSGITPDKTHLISEEIKRLDTEAKRLDDDKSRETKRKEKSKILEAELKEEIKKELEKNNIEILKN